MWKSSVLKASRQMRTSLVMMRTLIALCVLLSPVIDAHGGYRWCTALEQAQPRIVDRITADALKDVGSPPRALVRLKTEGRLPSHEGAKRSRFAELDFDKVRTLAYAWRLSRRNEFLISARGILLAWAATYRTRANPIDEERLPILIEGYALLRSDIDDRDRYMIDRWLRDIYLGHDAKMRANKRADNWQSHRIFIAASIAFALNDTEALQNVRDHYRIQILQNILPDGATSDFRKRNAILYSVYSLRPLVQTALLLMSADLYRTDSDTEVNARLSAGLNWLLPYVRGERIHQEFSPPRSALDRRRAAAGLSAFSGPFDPMRARGLFWLAAYLDREYLPVARLLANEPPDHLAACRGTLGGR